MPDEITFKPRTAANRHVEDQATIDALRARVAELERGEQVWKNLHNALERTASERDHYRAALEEMSQELSHYPEGDGIFGHLKRILRRAILNP